jgi:hypothetical protein
VTMPAVLCPCRYKHVGQPVMLIEPADEDFGMLGGCDETGAAAAAAAQLAAGMTRGGYMALLGDRPMFCVYLGVSATHSYAIVCCLCGAMRAAQPPGMRAGCLTWRS